ncbi:transglutaminase family protein [Variovorax saccharolyticus]|uniref:transglutaminase family protein n=1 Tax=Variovorax saccharolyticus TaxID=3053516 RepID=UPI002575C73C|nr:MULTISPECIES: transglutaminase family protein [unclassified Variovorax]MDM0020167.1 transglutaminase family protein [Variovorax sp. J22R187]MDM0023798.1 transglutaminase family protein [Variovorax sp. J31P216]
MAIRYDITHTTVYRYKTPVTFGLHRVMFRPRDSHDLRVLATDLEVSPQAYVRMIQDPHSNSVALVQPMGEATELRIVCSFTIEHVPTPIDELALDPAAEVLPFAYSLEERLDLEHYLRPHHDDPDGTLIRWAHQFLHTDQPNNTRDVLTRMNAHVGQSLRYVARDEEGTQTPLQTLTLGSGSCRDYALLMMEAARRLGIATRFVSGYLYDAALDTGEAEPGQAVTGSGSTHAWLHAYLPGAGWVAFDPTNNLMASSQLIRVGVARDPALAAPISGSWYGDAEAYEGLEATVVVRRLPG